MGGPAIRKVLYITGSRADFGLMKNTLIKIHSNTSLDLSIIACGMHLMKEYGNTLDEITQSDFNVDIANVTFKKNDRSSMASYIGELICSLVKKIELIKPDILLLLGDRGEMLAGATVGAYLGIPVAHIHGGEKSSTIDEAVRHAITKLSHLHFCSTEESYNRLKKLGEKTENIFITGAPGLDGIKQNILKSDEIYEIYALKKNEPFVILLQHPVSEELGNASNQIKESLEAIKSMKIQCIVIYPNADAGSKEMIDEINKYSDDENFKIHKNVERAHFLSLLNTGKALIGNSSAGVSESSSFKIPVINIGNRQKNRQSAKNVIHCDYNKNDIIKTMDFISTNEQFKKTLKQLVNPHGDGSASQKIIEVLIKKEINESLLQKQITY
ncbi:MAG: UDP-N-acetylglucosamine 2-epimerase (hydrolyzing) [Bacteroidia bacterium]|nr:UDP-N-acetylglucosamine 2-epimerase (hydrolyzing) [Bacteroidia bacterium]